MADLTWPSVLGPLVHGQDLSPDEAAWAMDEIMAGEATPAQLAGFVVALRAKGETADEMEGLARSMLGHARRIEVTGPAVDVVGTGGDLAHTVNLSTMAALVVAGTGCARREARQPRGVVGVRHGRRPRGAGRRPHADPRAGRGGR